MFLPKVPTAARATLQKNAVSHPAESTTHTRQSVEGAFVPAREHISHRASTHACFPRTPAHSSRRIASPHLAVLSEQLIPRVRAQPFAQFGGASLRQPVYRSPRAKPSSLCCHRLNETGRCR